MQRSTVTNRFIGNPSKVLALILLILGLGSCASMSEGECLAGDWRGVGYKDGAAGQPMSQVDRHAKACAKYDVTPDLQSYEIGRDDGLSVYCREENGLRVGVRGGTYAGVCPADSHGTFWTAYNAGRRLYILNNEVSSLENEIESHHHELSDLRDEMDKLEEKIVDGDTPEEERQRLVSKLERIAEERGEIRAEIDQIDHELHRLIRQRNNYRFDLQDEYGYSG